MCLRGGVVKGHAWLDYTLMDYSHLDYSHLDYFGLQGHADYRFWTTMKFGLLPFGLFWFTRAFGLSPFGVL